MRFQSFVTLMSSSLVVMAMALMAPSVVSGQDGPVPPTTPPGVTLVDVVRELPASSDLVLWTRLGDAEGRTVFRSNADSPGVSRCEATWAVEFPPLLADAGRRRLVTGRWFDGQRDGSSGRINRIRYTPGQRSRSRERSPPTSVSARRRH